MPCLTVCVPPATVYDDLSHPPATYLGTKYAHRMPDGSYNNISDPTMGKAEEPYARSVQQQHALPNNMLPDPGLVFDALLKREKVHDPLPSGIFIHSPLTCMVLVRQAPCRTFQLHVFFRSACHPYVSLLAFHVDAY